MQQDGTIEKRWASSANSLGGWSLRIKWQNGFKKSIKYVFFKIDFHNRVGDLVSDDVSGHYHFEASVTGPISDSVKETNLWENIIWTREIITLKIVSISVQFMDGSSLVIPGNQVYYSKHLY